MLPLASIVILILDEENQMLMSEVRGEHVTLRGKQSCLSVSMIRGLFFLLTAHCSGQQYGGYNVCSGLKNFNIIL